MIETVKAYKCSCQHCGHAWQTARAKKPRICPKCKTPRWNQEPMDPGRPKKA